MAPQQLLNAGKADANEVGESTLRANPSCIGVQDCRSDVNRRARQTTHARGIAPYDQGKTALGRYDNGNLIPLTRSVVNNPNPSMKPECVVLVRAGRCLNKRSIFKTGEAGCYTNQGVGARLKL